MQCIDNNQFDVNGTYSHEQAYITILRLYNLYRNGEISIPNRNYIYRRKENKKEQKCGAISHSEYQNMLKEKGIRQSMSRKGNCLDNSVMENFFGLLKSEIFYLKNFKSIEEFILELEEYIVYYNNKRIKIKLKGLGPIQYRLQSLTVA